MSGYDGGSRQRRDARQSRRPPGTPVPGDDSASCGHPTAVRDRAPSVRGRAPSGEFDLFCWRSALDGKRSSTTGFRSSHGRTAAMGLLGHSYGGITGFMVAATQPQHLTAILSGLIDDLTAGSCTRVVSATMASPHLDGRDPHRVRRRRRSLARPRPPQRGQPLTVSSSAPRTPWVRAELSPTIRCFGPRRDGTTVPEAFADQLRRQDQGADPTAGVPGRADGAARPRRTSSGASAASRSAHAHERRPQHRAGRLWRARYPTTGGWTSGCGVNGGFGASKKQRARRSASSSRRTRRSRSTRDAGRKEVLVPTIPGREDLPTARYQLDGLVPPRRQVADNFAPAEPSHPYVTAEAPVLVVSGQRRRQVPLTMFQPGGRASYRSVPFDRHRRRRADNSDLFVRAPLPTPCSSARRRSAGQGRTYLQRVLRRVRTVDADFAPLRPTVASPTAAAHEPDEHHARPDLQAWSRVWPVRRVPGRAPCLGQGARAAVRRQLLCVRAAQRAGCQHGAPGTRHAVADHAAHGPAHRRRARAGAAVRRSGSRPLRRAARLTPPESA